VLTGLADELKTLREKAPKKPTAKRFKTNNTTVEKLGELLRENPAGILVERDELVGLIASWEKEGHEADRAFYLEGWNGYGSDETDRIKRGSIWIPDKCISVFGGIQPDRLTAYLEQAEDALANDGMLQRFQLMVYPDPYPWQWVDRFPDRDKRNIAFGVFDQLKAFDPVNWGAYPADDFVQFPYFHFDDEAQALFIEWTTDLHQKRIPAEEHPIIAQHLSKFDKLFPALALIFHLVECAAARGEWLDRRGPAPVPTRVTKEAALRAGAWCELLEKHARRCYGLLIDDGLRSAKALASKVRQGRVTDGFTARDVRRNRWRYLTKGPSVQAALDWLEDDGWIRSQQAGGEGPGTGRRACTYSINPGLKP
jgi:hypothetical protein